MATKNASRSAVTKGSGGSRKITITSTGGYKKARREHSSEVHGQTMEHLPESTGPSDHKGVSYRPTSYVSESGGLTKEMKELTATITSAFETPLAEHFSTVVKEIQSLKDQQATKDKQISELVMMLRNKDSETQRLRKELERKTAEAVSSVQQREEAEKQVQMCSEQIAALESYRKEDAKAFQGQISQLRTEHQQMSALLHQEQQRANSFQEKILQIQDELKNKETDCNRAVSYSEECKVLADQLKSELKRYDVSLRTCQQNLERAEEDLKAARSVPRTKQVGRSAAQDLQIQQGGNHDELLQEVEEVFTDPDGILGTLEKYLPPYEAKVLLCEAFQAAHIKSTNEAIYLVHGQLRQLFQKSGPSRMLDFTSRAYGMLLYATEAQSDRVISQLSERIRKKVREALESSQLFARVRGSISTEGSTSSKEVNAAVNQIVRLAWRLVTLPSPIIVCQPTLFDETIMDKATTHWNQKARRYNLVYSEPVVYRSYHGTTLARKGIVANVPVSTGELQEQSALESHAGRGSCVVA